MTRNFALADAGDYLRWLQEPGPRRLDDLGGVDIFAFVGLGTLARVDAGRPLTVEFGAGPVSRFAEAVGLSSVVSGRPRRAPTEPERSVTLARFRRPDYLELDGLTRGIARLIAQRHAGAEVDAITYVLVELLRNVVQHSDDPLGGVMAAQMIERSGVSKRVQVAVGDGGVGIFEALTHRMLHPEIRDVQQALEKALHPYLSGTFREGQTGTLENAGLGLYVLSELAKITGGSFLLASRGDSLLLRDVHSAKDRAVFLDAGGFPGTLVVFECVIEALADFPSLFKGIRENARVRRPAHIGAGVVVFVEEPPEGVQRYLISVAGEDTRAAIDFARITLLPHVVKGEAIILDFVNWTVLSQSYLHALLYLVIRMAWATKATIYVTHASVVMRGAIEWIESYALVG